MLRCEICPCGTVAIISRVAPGYDGKGDPDGTSDPVQIIKVPVRALPALFLRLPAATKADALDYVWQVFDMNAGRRPLPIRLPPVRTPLGVQQ